MITESDAGAAFDLPKEQLLSNWYDSELRRTTGVGYRH